MLGSDSRVSAGYVHEFVPVRMRTFALFQSAAPKLLNRQNLKIIYVTSKNCDVLTFNL